MESQDLQDTPSAASTPASTLSPETDPNSPAEATQTALDAQSILAAVRGMSDTERRKLIAALHVL
jgi:hypothetical protein